MVAGADLGKGIYRQLVIVDPDAVKIGVQRAAQIGVEHEFFVGHAEKTIEEACRMQDEVRTAMDGGQHRHRAFGHRLRVGQL